MNGALRKALLAATVAVLSATVMTPVAQAALVAQPKPPAYPKLGQPPVGANDWHCKPTSKRPRPAVIVHGTFGDQKSLLDNLSYALKSDGYCVYSLDYGNRGTGPIAHSAHQLKRFVNRVMRSTGARKVEMVGHSQGGMMPRYYIKYLGGRRHVEDLVGLSPSNHGTTINGGMPGPTTGCRACDQQRAGSPFLRRLNHPDETPGPVDYTQVTTTHDEVVVPYTSAFLHGRRSTNIVLQDRCPTDAAEHVTIPMDRQAIAWVLNAFDRPGPANKHAKIGCLG